MKKRKHKEPCWCYTGEISLCGECDREFILLDIRFFRKLPTHIKAEVTKARKKDFANRAPIPDWEYCSETKRSN